VIGNIVESSLNT